MGLLVTKVWNRLFGSKNHFKILVLGLANAGKTTFLY
jgi:GTPase SAR1 family protein